MQLILGTSAFVGLFDFAEDLDELFRITGLCHAIALEFVGVRDEIANGALDRINERRKDFW